MNRSFCFSLRSMMVVSVFGMLTCAAFAGFFQDAAKGVIKRQHCETFFSADQGPGEGDTLTLYPKRPLSDGSLMDYPRGQLFEVRITQGAYYAVFVFPGDRTSVDTINVREPIRMRYPFGSQITVRWDVYALNVDTTGEYLMVRRDSKQMMKEVRAPGRLLKARILQGAGYLKLNLGNSEGARECFRSAIAVDSVQRFRYVYDMACTFARDSNVNEALTWLRRAFSTGYESYIHALKNDRDLASIRHLPEFRSIVTAPLVRRRAQLMKSIQERPWDAGELHFQIGRSYLEQADVDSFFIAYEHALQHGFYRDPRMLEPETFAEVKRDPRFVALTKQYADRYENRLFSEFEAALNPGIVRRLECNQYLDGVAKCPNLRELRIMHSARGELPSAIAALNHLHAVRFIDCGFNSFPVGIAGCVNLDTLTAEEGGARSLPADFGNLVRLRHLRLCKGRLEALPSSFRNLQQLANISLSGNAFSAFPPELLSLPHLESLNLSGNSIAEVPPSLGSLTTLTMLSLADNRIDKGAASVCSLRNLKTLDLSLNCLTSLPDEIANLRRLENLDLSFNELRSIPRGIRSLQSLKTLIIFGNKLDSLEIDTLRVLLPRCRIIGEEQDQFKPSTAVGENAFRDDSLGISFTYPQRYTLSRLKGEKDSSEIVIQLSKVDSTESEINTVTYTFTSEASLTIHISTEGFEDLASGAGFEKKKFVKDTADTGEESSEPGTLWVSLGRQGMEEGVSAISYRGWRGFWGTNYTGTFGEAADGTGSGYRGLREFSVAMARKKIENGRCVSLECFSDIYEDENLFVTVLSSLQIHPGETR